MQLNLVIDGLWVIRTLDLEKTIGLLLPLVVHFWDIYSICHEKCQTISRVLDGSTIRLTIRRNFSPKVMEQWFAFENIIVIDDIFFEMRIKTSRFQTNIV